ncbi:hypothetical protein EGW08_013686 [Elysia chlorotica]|uniref:Uncharacterized protein n=1 Tax=Elysia chlorotica TaxID=188477 RepID=A0A433TAB4_ELYCH|nr:hypothetical protein EGW08_013686 [Elysia chlorotica]
MAGCSQRADIERPMRYVEVVNGNETWFEYGLRMRSTYPENDGSTVARVGTPLSLRVCVDVRRDPQRAPQCIHVFCWTNIRTDDNPCGIWKEIHLPLNPSVSSPVDGYEDLLQYVYEGSLVPSASDSYRLTFLLKWNHILLWHNGFMDDGFVDVI